MSPEFQHPKGFVLREEGEGVKTKRGMWIKSVRFDGMPLDIQIQPMKSEMAIAFSLEGALDGKPIDIDLPTHNASFNRLAVLEEKLHAAFADTKGEVVVGNTTTGTPSFIIRASSAIAPWHVVAERIGEYVQTLEDKHINGQSFTDAVASTPLPSFTDLVLPKKPGWAQKLGESVRNGLRIGNSV